MPGFAGLPVLCHCLAKTNGLQLGSHRCTLWSGAGETIQLQPHLALWKDEVPGGLFWCCSAIHPASLLPQKQWVILVTTALALDVSTATCIFLLATEWVCGMTQHLVAFLHQILLLSSGPFTQLHPQPESMFFSDRAGEDRQTHCGFPYLSVLVSIFSQDRLVALTILRHLPMVWNCFFHWSFLQAGSTCSQLTPLLTMESLVSPNSWRMPDLSSA